jgi:hypothetical protein
MLESLRNLRTSEIELKNRLPPPESDDRLLIEYDADLFGSAELLAFLRYCGVPVAALRAGAA